VQQAAGAPLEWLFTGWIDHSKGVDNAGSDFVTFA
jgi:hypothetical protein